MDDFGETLTPLSSVPLCFPGERFGGAGEQQGVQTASAPLVPLKHRPPTPRGAPGTAPALCGELGRG